jgi:hypothetical protein
MLDRRVWLGVMMLVAACKAHGGEVVDAAAPLPLEGFEGEIDEVGDVAFTYGVPDSGTHTELKVEIKGEKIRVERDAKWVTIVDPGAKQSVSFDTTTRLYLKSALAESTDVATVKRTGSGTVAGIPCEVWEGDDLLGHRTLCLAPGLRKKFMFRAEPTWSWSSGDVVFANGFPLRDDTRAGGQTMSHVETTRIIRRPVPDADFVLPEGYKERPPLGLHP